MKRSKSTVVKQDKDSGVWYFGEKVDIYKKLEFQSICKGCCFDGKGLYCYQPNSMDCCHNNGHSLVMWKEIGEK